MEGCRLGGDRGILFKRYLNCQVHEGGVHVDGRRPLVELRRGPSRDNVGKDIRGVDEIDADSAWGGSVRGRRWVIGCDKR